MTARNSDVLLERLTRLHPKLIDLSLGRLERLLDRLKNPHCRLPPAIHVAGTNGKGSVIAYMRAALIAAGRTVHVYTSPHLVRFHERIELAGKVIDECALAGLLEECETANRGEPITFFEVTTAAAFLAFSRKPADILLLETGLGGRLDATNVVERPLVSVITPVSLDHQQFLGDTLAEIAGEKAGIIKREVSAVIGPQEDEALAVLVDRAHEMNAPTIVAGRDFTYHRGPDRLAVCEQGERIVLPAPVLTGAHQSANAATAVAALRLLGDLAPDIGALSLGMRTARWPARLQHLASGRLVSMLGRERELWLDGGHNPAAGRVLADMAKTWSDRPLDMVIGMMNTKDPAGFIRPLAPLVRRAIAVEIPGERNSFPVDETLGFLKAAGLMAEKASGIEDAIERLSFPSCERSRVLVCGSLYLAGRTLLAND